MASTTVNRNDAMVREFLAAWERRDTEHIMACWPRTASQRRANRFRSDAACVDVAAQMARSCPVKDIRRDTGVDVTMRLLVTPPPWN